MAVSQMAGRVARLAKKNPATAKDIELWAYKNLGLRVGSESVRKALHGSIDPTQCAVELLMALTGFYGVEPEALGHIAADRLHSVLAYASTQAPPDGPGGQEMPPTIWKNNVVTLRARKAA